jgi:hypothetical protein
MALPSAEIYNRRLRELTGQTRPRRPQRPPTTNENLGPLPHVQHFSNSLGVLNPHDGPIGVDVFGYPVPPVATQADLDFYLSNPDQARPSATTSSRLQVQDYEREGGWMVDAFGRQYYQARGKLEEISSEQDDNDIKSATNAFHDKKFNHHEPRRPLTALSPMNTGNGSGGINLQEFASRSASPLPPSITPPPAPRFEDGEPVFSPPFISEYQPFVIIAPHTPSRTSPPPASLPPNTTPPPRPRFRQMRELSPTSTVHPRHVVNGYAPGPTPLRTMTPAPHKNHTIIGPLDTETEIGLVQECLRLVTTTVQDVQFMYTVCIHRARFYRKN